MLHVTLEFLAFLAAHLEKASSNLNECSPLSCMLILIMFCRVLMLSLLLMSVLMRFILYYMPYRFMKSIYCWIHKTNKSSCSDIYSAHDFFCTSVFFSRTFPVNLKKTLLSGLKLKKKTIILSFSVSSL